MCYHRDDRRCNCRCCCPNNSAPTRDYLLRVARFLKTKDRFKDRTLLLRVTTSFNSRYVASSLHIPVGTIVEMSSSYGYGLASINGRLHNISFNEEQYHCFDWSPYNDEINCCC